MTVMRSGVISINDTSSEELRRACHSRRSAASLNLFDIQISSNTPLWNPLVYARGVKFNDGLSMAREAGKWIVSLSSGAASGGRKNVGSRCRAGRLAGSFHRRSVANLTNEYGGTGFHEFTWKSVTLATSGQWEHLEFRFTRDRDAANYSSVISVDAIRYPLTFALTLILPYKNVSLKSRQMFQ